MEIDSIYSEHDPLGSYMRLIRAYLDASPEVQDEIQRDWDFGREWACPRALELPGHDARYSVRERALACLTSLIINNPWSDVRDVIMSIAIVYHGVRLGGDDPDQVLMEFASRTRGEIPDLVRSFVNRDEENKSMKAFRLEPVHDNEGHAIGLRVV
jgi:hypothetical protein